MADLNVDATLVALGQRAGQDPARPTCGRH